MSYNHFTAPNYNNPDPRDLVKSLYETVTKERENLLVAALGDLVKKGLLVVEHVKEPILVNDFNSDQAFRYCEEIRLVLKDKEYIEKLEKENQELRLRLDVIKQATSK